MTAATGKGFCADSHLSYHSASSASTSHNGNLPNVQSEDCVAYKYQSSLTTNTEQTACTKASHNLSKWAFGINTLNWLGWTIHI